MLAPERVEGWFDPEIWAESHLDFFGVLHRARLSQRAIGRIDLMPFQIPRSRHAHEMAHFICVPDRDVLDPFWGIVTGTSLDGDPGYFDDTWALVELEVLTVQALLDGRNGDPPSFAAVHLSPRVRLDGIEPTSEGEREAFYLLRNLAGDFVKKWTREALWAECVRKTRLVRELRGMPPGPW